MAKAPLKTKATAAKAIAAKKAPAVKMAPVVAAPAKPEVDPDAITYSGADKTMKHAGKLVVKAGKETVMIDGDKLTRQLSRLCEVGKSFAAVKDYLESHGKQAPALAKGVESRQNPHSAKAVSDSRAKASGGAAKVKTGEKAPSAAKLPPKDVDPSAKITATDKGAAKVAKVGPNDRLAQMVKAGNVGDALKHMSMADIRYAARVGLITLG